MEYKHPISKIVRNQNMGISEGVFSACTASDYVIEAVLERALKFNMYAVIESTANQVNQYGGYTNMRPVDYRDFVFSIAKKVNFPENKIILGGDHLGPLIWSEEKADDALEKAKILVRDYVLAGFTKIHIDTSMKLADDDRNSLLDTAVIAERGACICAESEAAYRELLKIQPDALAPVYVIGSEVPIPGGQQEREGVQVTKTESFKKTIEEFKGTFSKYNIEHAWERVIAVVVQPGVEFGDETIHEYDRKAAEELTVELRKYPGIVFEGHSTDYQTAERLKQMVEDGIAILKVGPALTFAEREALFALNHIENELFKYNPNIELSHFIEELDLAMVKNPAYWKKHYCGNGDKIKYSRKYSYSDRCRYYLPSPDVKESIKLLINNLKTTQIPLTLINQFMPIQYYKIRHGQINSDPESLLKDRIINCVDDYIHAITPTGGNRMCEKREC
jgi:D-tagatose-1,6-bisphosphate aldolase subunit GatZ/KbaZ